MTDDVRRFRNTGPDRVIGGRNTVRISQTIGVKTGEVAVLKADDDRIPDFERWDYFEELDAEGNVIEKVVEDAPENDGGADEIVNLENPEGDDSQGDEEATKNQSRRRQRPTE
jgi:hypothetical protein